MPKPRHRVRASISTEDRTKDHISTEDRTKDHISAELMLAISNNDSKIEIIKLDDRYQEESIIQLIQLLRTNTSVRRLDLDIVSPSDRICSALLEILDTNTTLIEISHKDSVFKSVSTVSTMKQIKQKCALNKQMIYHFVNEIKDSFNAILTTLMIWKFDVNSILNSLPYEALGNIFSNFVYFQNSNGSLSFIEFEIASNLLQLLEGGHMFPSEFEPAILQNESPAYEDPAYQDHYRLNLRARTLLDLRYDNTDEKIHMTIFTEFDKEYLKCKKIGDSIKEFKSFDRERYQVWLRTTLPSICHNYEMLRKRQYAGMLTHFAMIKFNDIFEEISARDSSRIYATKKENLAMINKLRHGFAVIEKDFSLAEKVFNELFVSFSEVYFKEIEGTRNYAVQKPLIPLFYEIFKLELDLATDFGINRGFYLKDFFSKLKHGTVIVEDLSREGINYKCESPRHSEPRKETESKVTNRKISNEEISIKYSKICDLWDQDGVKTTKEDAVYIYSLIKENYFSSCNSSQARICVIDYLLRHLFDKVYAYSKGRDDFMGNVYFGKDQYRDCNYYLTIIYRSIVKITEYLFQDKLNPTEELNDIQIMKLIQSRVLLMPEDKQIILPKFCRKNLDASIYMLEDFRDQILESNHGVFNWFR